MHHDNSTAKSGHSTGRLAALVILVLLLAVGFFAYLNRQHIVDQITVWRFQPSSQVAALVTDSGMSDHGEFLFYASEPQLDDRTSFNQNCTQKEAQSIVLGCYVNNRIYVFNVTDQRIAGAKDVTAAHEMLHAAYARLSDSERTKINALLESEFSNSNDKDLKSLMALYAKTEPGQRDNELHSILGTEVAGLSPDLEKYYARYFSDRSTVVAAAKKYKKVFKDLESQQKTLASEMDSLKKQIDTGTAQYNSDADQLAGDVDRFNTCAKTTGCFSSQAAFQAQRAALLTRQDVLDALASRINAQIAQYNSDVAKYNDLGGTAEELTKNLDSRQEISQ